MEQTTLKSPTAELLDAVYKNVKSASDALLSIMPKVRDEKLKNDMTVQISVYEGFASRAAKLLAEEGEKPQEKSMMQKVSSRVSTMMSTARNSTPAHLAELIIEGAHMGENDILCKIREAEAKHVSGEPLRLAKHLCEYEENVAEDMKSYLR